MKNQLFTEHGLSDTLKEGLFLTSTLAGKRARGVDFNFLLKQDKSQREPSSIGARHIHSSAHSNGDSLVGRNSRVRRAFGRALYYLQVAFGVALITALGGIVGLCFFTPCPSL